MFKGYSKVNENLQEKLKAFGSRPVTSNHLTTRNNDTRLNNLNNDINISYNYENPDTLNIQSKSEKPEETKITEKIISSKKIICRTERFKDELHEIEEKLRNKKNNLIKEKLVMDPTIPLKITKMEYKKPDEKKKVKKNIINSENSKVFSSIFLTDKTNFKKKSDSLKEENFKLIDDISKVNKINFYAFDVRPPGFKEHFNNKFTIIENEIIKEIRNLEKIYGNTFNAERENTLNLINIDKDIFDFSNKKKAETNINFSVRPVSQHNFKTNPGLIRGYLRNFKNNKLLIEFFRYKNEKEKKEKLIYNEDNLDNALDHVETYFIGKTTKKNFGFATSTNFFQQNQLKKLKDYFDLKQPSGEEKNFGGYPDEVQEILSISNILNHQMRNFNNSKLDISTKGNRKIDSHFEENINEQDKNIDNNDESYYEEPLGNEEKIKEDLIKYYNIQANKIPLSNLKNTDNLHEDVFKENKKLQTEKRNKSASTITIKTRKNNNYQNLDLIREEIRERERDINFDELKKIINNNYSETTDFNFFEYKDSGLQENRRQNINDERINENYIDNKKFFEENEEKMKIIDNSNSENKNKIYSNSNKKILSKKNIKNKISPIRSLTKNLRNLKENDSKAPLSSLIDYYKPNKEKYTKNQIKKYTKMKYEKLKEEMFDKNDELYNNNIIKNQPSHINENVREKKTILMKSIGKKGSPSIPKITYSIQKIMNIQFEKDINMKKLI
jgi:hypothetical protein